MSGANAVERPHSGGLDRAGSCIAGLADPDAGGSTMKARLFTAAASLTALLAALGGTVYGR